MNDEKYINQDLANPISKLSEKTELCVNDCFALFRTKLDGNASSYKLSYGEFMYQLVSDISARFGLSSMAFRDKSEYARFDHQHNYSNVACYPALSGKESEKILTLRIKSIYNDDLVDIYMPKVSVPSRFGPKIGDIRFLANDQITAEYGNTYVEQVHIRPDGQTESEFWLKYNVNLQITNAISAGTFDGWVYPDGSSYFKAQGVYDFSEAYSAFGGTNDEFSVPTLSNFIKANPGVDCNNALKSLPGQTGIVPHTHQLKPYHVGEVEDISLTATVKIAQSPTFDSSKKHGDGTLHVGSDTEKGDGVTCLTADPVILNLNFTESDNKNFTYDPDPNDESYPAHCVIPVQIYIGGKYIGKSGSEKSYGVQVTYTNNITKTFKDISRLTRSSIGVTGEFDDRIRKVVVGGDITEIENGIFAGFTELTEVDMRNCSVEVEVPEGCCEGCGKLVSFTFPMS